MMKKSAVFTIFFGILLLAVISSSGARTGRKQCSLTALQDTLSILCSDTSPNVPIVPSEKLLDECCKNYCNLGYLRTYCG